MKRQRFLASGLALVVITAGVCFQWLLLGVGNPWSVVATLQQKSDAQRARSPIMPVQTGRQRSDFQTGIVFPRWGATAYSATDPNWLIGLQEIREQTNAGWLQITVNLYQASATSTQVQATAATPTPEALAAGIRAAHLKKYHVFVVPLLSVVGKEQWAGEIHYQTSEQTQTWFESYWHAFRPYVRAAAAAGAEQLSIGTELEGLQRAPASLWNQLIARTHALFAGRLTYDMNWTYQIDTLPSWMRNPDFSAIGVSAYYPLVSSSQRLPPAEVAELWGKKVRSYLDLIAARLGKPVLISEIGYRDRADALFRPGQTTSTAAVDEAEQAAAFHAALRNSLEDKHIIGMFVWGWSVPLFQPNWRPAAQIIKSWYSSVKAEGEIQT
jgi:hypothetical protein